MEVHTQSTPLSAQEPIPNEDPRVIFAGEFAQWWKESGKKRFRQKQDLAAFLGITRHKLRRYTSSKFFPSLAVCEKLYPLSGIPSVEPTKAAEIKFSIYSKASAGRGPEVFARISEAQIGSWKNNPNRSIAHLHTEEVRNKARETGRTLESRRKKSVGVKLSWTPERRKRKANQQKERLAKEKAERTAQSNELLRLRAWRGNVGRNRKDKQRQRVKELKEQGLKWQQIKEVMDKEFGKSSSVGSYQDLLRDRHK